MNKKLKKYILKYTLEFLVIVLGISISFWLNELSVEKNENREKTYKYKVDHLIISMVIFIF